MAGDNAEELRLLQMIGTPRYPRRGPATGDQKKSHATSQQSVVAKIQKLGGPRDFGGKSCHPRLWGLPPPEELLDKGRAASALYLQATKDTDTSLLEATRCVESDSLMELTGVDREEKAPPCKGPLDEDHDSQTRAQRSKPLTSNTVGQGHGLGPAPCCVSLKSDRSMGEPIDFGGRQHRQWRSSICQEKEAELTCVSLRSDRSMGEPIDFRGGLECQRRSKPFTSDEAGLGPEPGPAPICESLKSDRSMGEPIDFRGRQDRQRRMNQQVCDDHTLHFDQHDQTDLDSTLQLLEETVMTMVKKELKRVQGFLRPDGQKNLDDQEEEELKCVDELMRSSREAFLKIFMNILRSMEKDELADDLWSRSHTGVYAGGLKRSLQKKFHRVFEGVAKAGNSATLNQIYTELYITKESTDQINQEHEVQQITEANRNQTRPETTIILEDLFKESTERGQPIRSLLTKGIAGIGKTLLTQKLTLDWAEDKAHQNFQLMFPFTFRELNLLKQELNFVELVHRFFPETKQLGLGSFEEVQVLFILDGLDECRLPLDFSCRVLTEATESTSVDVLLTNLIRGKLLPSARLWITTRPAAANQIPPECVNMVTEVRGFTDQQKEEYFRKRFRDQDQATIISHIRSSQSLYIMCHIPIFCWITATVLEDMMKNKENDELPKSLTEMYIHFLVVQVKVKKIKYHAGAGTDRWDPQSRKMIESLGKLAFEQLHRGNLIFYESDLIESGIDITDAAVYSGVFTQIFKEERGLYQDKVFCFIHLTVQEFLAALHLHLKFFNTGLNLLHSQQPSILSRVIGNKHQIKQFYQREIKKAVESPNGHMDLFLRFLLGLSLQARQSLLQGLLTQTGKSSWTAQDTAELIKRKIKKNVSPERTLNLFHCLSEVKDTSLVEEVQQLLESGLLSADQLSPTQLSALAFIIVSSEKDLDVFDLKKYSASEVFLERLLSLVQRSKDVLLRECGLSEKSGGLLSSVLSTKSSRLKKLDLSYNILQDSGVEQLSFGLKSPHCQLETLSLWRCNLSKRSGEHLSTVLCTSFPPESSRLKELDLSYNKLQDSGVESLSAGLMSTNCHLKTLRLLQCNLSKRSGELLSTVLSCPSTSLTELDLSSNYDLQDEGVKLLSAGLKSPHCQLETLSLRDCQLSYTSGKLLSPVLSSPSSRLKHLDLRRNKLKDEGVELLCAGLKSPHCHLETLGLSWCRISERGCASLASALTANPSHLKVLDLGYNHPEGPGLQQLFAGVNSPDWSLEAVRVVHGGPEWSAVRNKPAAKTWVEFSRRNNRNNGGVISLPNSDEVQSLLQKDVIKPMRAQEMEGGFYSCNIAVPRKLGGFRPILDLSFLNRFLACLRFRMLTTKRLLQCVRPSDWMVSSDLADAYFHILFCRSHRRFFRHFLYICLPFGDSLAQCTFTKCVEVALKPLCRSRSHKATGVVCELQQELAEIQSEGGLPGSQPGLRNLASPPPAIEHCSYLRLLQLAGITPLDECKVIYVMRNPKDVFTSSFHYYGMASYLVDPGPKAEFLRKFLDGQIMFGSWFDHVKGWLASDNKERVMYISYEEMKMDLKDAVTRMVQFLGKSLDADVIEKIADRCLFHNMKQNKMSNYSLVGREYMDQEKSEFLRKADLDLDTSIIVVQDTSTATLLLLTAPPLSVRSGCGLQGLDYIRNHLDDVTSTNSSPSEEDDFFASLEQHLQPVRDVSVVLDSCCTITASPQEP
ncbi:NACHT, LRR and PYD domains-containing protein 5-like [Synchiropus splendidus]|uniref:NACHT, LRR and PYD domains-containing protein 5-like n=1 Tax=Synchiropus splendidus TaxID=270530 RepID=UPI00237EB7E5|nr:NACHT, LRR and PYD domains-containing protein 5-like [Synchiropus splendidus]